LRAESGETGAGRPGGRVSGGEFDEDGAGGGDGIGGFENGAADHDVGGAGAGGFAGSHDAGLVAGIGAAGSDAGGDEGDIGREHGAERREFKRRAHQAAEAGVDGEAPEADDVVGGRGGDAGLGEALGAHRGEDGDAEKKKVGGVLLLGFDGPLHHLAAAGGMQREHLDRERRDGFYGLGDGVGDVVELEVEEDIETEVGDFAHAVGTAGGEHFEADLDPADGALELAEGGGDGARGLGVEDENEIGGHRWTGE